MYLAGLFKTFVVLSLTQQAGTEKLPVPVALYPLNGRHGTKDESPNKNPPGIPSHVQLAPGPHGHPQGSYHFSGSINSYIEIPNHGGLDTRYSITFLAWVNRKNEEGPIFSYGRATWGFHVWLVQNGNFVARSRGWPLDTSASPELSKSWNHVGVTYNFSSGVKRLWVNGEIRREVNVNSTELHTHYEVRLGAKDDAKPQSCFKGRICCIQVYSKALSRQEIIAVQNKTVWQTQDDHFHPVFPSQEEEQGVKPVLAAFAGSSVMECLLRCSRLPECNSVSIDGITSRERSNRVNCQLYRVKFEATLGRRDGRKGKQYYNKNDFV